jgi:integrating conjugative element protein (TIGR03756 family)
MGLSCEAGSTAFQPYFISASNPVFWYSGFIDSVMNITGYNRWIGERNNGQTMQLNDELWGHLYPRTGININTDHYKSSAVIAQRAIDMVFNGGFLLYSQEFGGDKKRYYIPAEKTEEWSDKYGKWQMLSPKKESKCHLLGDKSVKKDFSISDNETNDGWADRRSKNGSYAWHYWRQYECCQKPSGYTLLFKVTN